MQEENHEIILRSVDIQYSENEGAHNLIGKVVSSKPISHVGLKNNMSML